jgi:hypothetical protein
MSIWQWITSSGISEKVMEYTLAGIELIILTWAYAHRVLGFRLIKTMKKMATSGKNKHKQKSGVEDE